MVMSVCKCAPKAISIYHCILYCNLVARGVDKPLRCRNSPAVDKKKLIVPLLGAEVLKKKVHGKKS